MLLFNIIRFFAHPENILLCMIHDVRPHIRKLGLRRILNAKRNEKLEPIRSFVIPKLNFDADDYICLIYWQNNKITPPPLLHRLEINDLTNIIKEKPAKFLQICSFPCHTQAVARCIKLVTEASLSVVGHKKRDAFIKVSIESRKSMPQFESKKDFKQ